MKRFDVFIIGGGYSAMVLASCLKLKNKNLSVAIAEKMDRVGKKILSTGNGRANLSNENISIDNYHGNAREKVEYAIKKFDLNSLENFYQNLGLPLTNLEGKIFPLSLQANSVLDVLRMNLDGCCVMTETEITRVEKPQNKNEFFHIYSYESVFYAKKVVFAFGGSSSKQFGTDGKSFKLASNLGHFITRLHPSLVQMRSDESFINQLKGVKVQANVSLLEKNDDKKIVKSFYGDLLFVQGGLSGNTIFSLSAFLGEAKEPQIVVSFARELSVNRLIECLLLKRKRYPNAFSEDVLNGVVHKQLSRIIVKMVSNKKLIGELNDKEIKQIAELVKRFPISVSGVFGFDNSQVTRGGIDFSEVDEKTFESKIVNGLFIIGEALDVDGDCGGYNLHWAFSSAMCVAEELCKD